MNNTDNQSTDSKVLANTTHTGGASSKSGNQSTGKILLTVSNP
jgi:hypothetical protein